MPEQYWSFAALMRPWLLSFTVEANDLQNDRLWAVILFARHGGSRTYPKVRGRGPTPQPNLQALGAPHSRDVERRVSAQYNSASQLMPDATVAAGIYPPRP